MLTSSQERYLLSHIERLQELGFNRSTTVAMMRDLVEKPPIPLPLSRKPVSHDTEEVLRPIVQRCLGCAQRVSTGRPLCRSCREDLDRRIAEEKAQKEQPQGLGVQAGLEAVDAAVRD